MLLRSPYDTPILQGREPTSHYDRGEAVDQAHNDIMLVN